VSGVWFSSCFNAQNNTGWAGLGWARRDETICSSFHGEDVMTMSVRKELL
jgi:hypothetical protein